MDSRVLYYTVKMFRLAILIIGIAIVIRVAVSSLKSSPVPTADPAKPVEVKAAAPLHIYSDRININTASLEELMSLPTIGKVTGARIIEYREKHGPFKHSSDLIIIRGVSEHKFRQLEDLITTD